MTRIDTRSRIVSDLIPVAGVLLLGWDAHATLFILSCEVAALSLSLGWLFDHPRRSTARGVVTALVLAAPVTFLLWVVLAELQGVRPRSVPGTVAELLPVTWIAVATLSGHAVVATRRAMARARERGASIRTNDRILLRILLEAFLPFVVFAAVAAADRALGPAALTAILLARTAGDALVVRWAGGPDRAGAGRDVPPGTGVAPGPPTP